MAERPEGIYDWFDVPDAPEGLHDFPLDCGFCGRVWSQGDEPLRVVVTSWRRPAVRRQYVAHSACLERVTKPLRDRYESD